MEWSTEKLLQLIDLFKHKRCLWDPQDRNYKKSAVKDKAWDTISNELDGNAIVVKKKMESLLASFRRERKKYEIATINSGPEKVYISKWFAFNAMRFMNNRLFAKGPQMKVQTVQFDPLEESLQVDSSHSHDSYEHKRLKQNIDEISRKNTILELPSIPHRRRESNDYCYDEITVPDSTRRDPSSIFGEYVATKHRKYGDHVKNVVEHQIAQILFDADMGVFDPGTTTAVTISSRSPITETGMSGSPKIIYEK